MTDTVILPSAGLTSSDATVNAIVSVTIREQVITAIQAALAGLLVSNGYHGDGGQKVFRCQKNIPPEALPCVVVWPGTETAERSEYGGQLCAMKMGVEYIADAGTENPSIVAERMLGDLIKLVCGSVSSPFIDSILYESGGTDSYPEAGESVVGTKISVSVKYSYLHGNPYSQE